MKHITNKKIKLYVFYPAYWAIGLVIWWSFLIFCKQTTKFKYINVSTFCHNAIMISSASVSIYTQKLTSFSISLQQTTPNGPIRNKQLFFLYTESQQKWRWSHLARWFDFCSLLFWCHRTSDTMEYDNWQLECEHGHITSQKKRYVHTTCWCTWPNQMEWGNILRDSSCCILRFRNYCWTYIFFGKLFLVYYIITLEFSGISSSQKKHTSLDSPPLSIFSS